MHPVRSGTTTERIFRTGLLAAIVTAFAIAFLWDGHVGYVRKNARALAESLGLTPDQAPTVNPQLTAAEARRIMNEIGEWAPREEILSWLGDPPLRHKNELYYPGPGGHIRFQLKGGRVAKMGWTWGEHSETDLRWQRWIGYFLSAASVVLALHFLRVLTTRVSLTDAGLKLRGRPLVPFDAITALRTGETSAPDSVTLEYVLGGRTRVVRLDSYVMKELSAILDGICERAGFPHPGIPMQAASPEAETVPEEEPHS